MARKPQPLMRFRLARLHARLIVSAIFAVALASALSFKSELRLSTSVLIGWDSGVILYIALTYWMIAHAGIQDIRRRACTQDEGAFALVVLTAFVTLASLAAIIAELGKAGPGPNQVSHAVGTAIGMSTAVLSWLFLHTIFALHYAHEYYGEGGEGATGGLKFPGRDAPDYWDFLYFSFVIGMTSQVSDVAVTSKTIRRVITVHGVLSFFFNVSILALMVNMAAGLIKPGS